MALRALTALLLLTALASGCVETDGGPDDSPVTGGQAPTGVDAGSQATHREPERSESTVTVQREGDDYVAVQTVTISNDFGGADGAVVELTTRAGGIEAEQGSGGGYTMVIVLKSRAATDAAARSGLGRLSVVHSDTLGDNLALATEVRFPDSSNGLSGGISASLPKGPAYRLDLDTTSGGIAVDGLSGPEVDAQTSSGGIAIEGAFTVIKARASSGGIAIDAKARDVDALTGSGGVAASLEPLGSGTWLLEAGSGGVAVELVRGNAGYDVEADAASGGVQVSVRGSEEVGTQSAKHAHVRTTGFDAASTQVTVKAETGSGGVAVGDA